MVTPVGRVVRSVPRPVRRGFKVVVALLLLPAFVLAAGTGRPTTPAARKANLAGRPVSLPEAIDLALNTHPRITATAHAEAAAEHELKAKEALKLPRITFQNILKDSNHLKRYRPLGSIGPLLSDINDDSAMMTGAILEVPVYVGDRLAIIPRIALRKKEGQQQLRRKASQDLVLELVRLYLDALVAEKALKVEAERATLKELELRAAREKAASDAVAAPRVMSLELELDDIKQQQLEYTTQLDSDQQSLSELIGAPPGAVVELVGEFDMRELEGTPSDMLRIGRAENPDLRLLELALATAGEEIGLAASDEKLQMNFRADYFWDHTFERPDNGADVWTVALVTSWPLWDGGYVHQEKQRARDRVREAKSNLAAALQLLDLQMRQAYSTLTSSRKLVDGLEKNVSLARSTLQTVTDKYQVNVLSRADLVEARMNLMRAIVNRDRISARVLEARAALFRLMGRLEPAVFQAAPPSVASRGDS
ncbi:MAG: TolC family protein [Candidatus Riflebacteria bacterium]|nr:TolC family protein [Candidatus Riflebacteria bacterium]